MAQSTSRIQRFKPTRRRLVTAQPYQAPSGTFYIRRKVPEELRELLGMREYKRSLKTSDASAARIRHAEEFAKSERLFAGARSELAGRPTVTLREVQQLAADWFRAEQARMEGSGSFLDYLETDGSTTHEWAGGYEVFHHIVSIAEAQNVAVEVDVPRWALKAAEGAFRARGMPPPREGSGARKWAIQAFSEHLLKLSALALARHNGDWQKSFPVLPAVPVAAEGAPPPPQVRAAAGGVSLRRLFTEFAAQKRLDEGANRAVEKTLKTYEAALDTFIELMGDVPVAGISRAQIAEYRGLLAQLPRGGKGMGKLTAPERIARARAEALPLISAATIRNRVVALSAILAFGERMRYLSENPVTGSGVRKATARAAAKSTHFRQARSDYSREELKQIFESPLFSPQGWEPPRAKLGRALYWLPLMLYYTGARREELAQLKVGDVRSSDGITYVDLLTLQDKGEARTVKTDSSRRQIPLHPDLIARGFLTYVEGLPRDGMLFPALRPGPDGYYGTGFGKHWGNYLDKVVGLNSSVAPSHGFRHTFKTMCRAVQAQEDVHDAITGHVGRSSVSRQYGSMPLSSMYQVICLIPSVADLLSR